jgi:D-alanyl-D-alanine carboxypeptidase (penicillin-binding protein 5/6)
MEYPDWDEFDENDPSKRATRYWVNKNRLLNKNNAKEYYPYATGIKTGYTSHSGHCLVSSATKDGLNLIAVVLKSTRDGQWTDSKKLLEYGFTNYTMYEPLKDGQVVTTIQVANHAPDDSGTLNIVAAQGFRDVFPKDNIAKIQQITEWYYTDENGLLHLEAPVFKGQVVGRLTYKIDNQAVAQIKLIAERGVLKKKSIIDMITPEPNENISGSSGKRPHLWAVLVFLVILFINIVYVLRRKRRKRYNYLRRYR